jgi:hypothetical protein
LRFSCPSTNLGIHQHCRVSCDLVRSTLFGLISMSSPYGSNHYQLWWVLCGNSQINVSPDRSVSLVGRRTFPTERWFHLECSLRKHWIYLPSKQGSVSVRPLTDCVWEGTYTCRDWCDFANHVQWLLIAMKLCSEFDWNSPQIMLLSPASSFVLSHMRTNIGWSKSTSRAFVLIQ